MGLSRPLLSAPLRKLPKAICPSCGETFEPELLCPEGNTTTRRQVFCGKQACYAEGIRAYWRALGYEACVKYEDSQPRLVDVPTKV